MNEDDKNSECDGGKRFTEYSMTSSIVPRSEGNFCINFQIIITFTHYYVILINGYCIFVALTNLDERFEEVSCYCNSYDVITSCNSYDVITITSINN